MKWTIAVPVSIEKRRSLLGSWKHMLMSIGMVKCASAPACGRSEHLYTEITLPSNSSQRSSFHFWNPHCCTGPDLKAKLPPSRMVLNLSNPAMNSSSLISPSWLVSSAAARTTRQ